MIIDGKALSEKILGELKQKIQGKLKLSIILVGEDEGSKIYTKMKRKKSEEIGMECEIIKYPENVDEKEVEKKIKELNEDSSVNGIIIQLPLPLSSDLLNLISPKKDVDCLTAENLGNLLKGKQAFIPATPKGIMKLLENIELKGKNITIINHSNILGKPLAMLLLNKGATVNVCHEFTKNLKSHTLSADILITGVGKANLITEDMVKENSIVIDAGICKVDGKIRGDADPNISKKVSLTPVPGGVGPMTVAMLLENVVESL